MTTRIGFSTPRHFNPVSWLVRKLTGSRASHVWFLYADQDWGADFVLEAHELGFRLLPFERFEKENQVVRVVTPSEDIDDGVKWAAHWLGTAYDFSGLVGMAWVVLGRVFKRRWTNPLQNSRAMFCSEMTVEVLRRSGVPWAQSLVPSTVSPQDLLDLFERNEPRAPSLNAAGTPGEAVAQGRV